MQTTRNCQLTLTQRVVNIILKGITRILCRVDDAQLKRVPTQGPLILVANHINFLEVPLVITHLMPRKLTGFAKAETWENPVMGWLFSIWKAIPLRRGEADMDAIHRALEVLAEGYILGIAPEGTRSGHGRLQRGHPGIVMLALRSGAPLMPIGYYGGESIKTNLSKLRRTDFHITVGQPFYLNTGGVKVTHTVRQQMVDEIMYQLAAILPPYYRGVYSNLEEATTRYLRFPGGSRNNIPSKPDIEAGGKLIKNYA